jgi:purine-binding chemotaxis protein CheW
VNTDTDSNEMSQYLTFEVSGDEYAIGVLDAREIIPFEGCSHVPMAPKPVRGLINLRGRAVPILDLEIIFGRDETPISKRSCIVIVGANEDDEALMGILTESVNAVVEVSDHDIEPPPAFGTSAHARYLHGLAKIAENFVPVIDVGRVLSSETLEFVNANITAEDLEALESTTPGSEG